MRRRTEPSGVGRRCPRGAAGWLLLLGLAAAAAAGEDGHEAAGGYGVVVLDAPARRLAGIEVAEVAPRTVAREQASVALVVDPAPALEPRTRWQEARARVRAIDARRAALAARLERLAADPATTSRRELEALRAEVQALAAERAGVAARMQAARDELLLAWGDALTDRLLRPGDGDGLLAGRRRLLLVTIPAPWSARPAPEVRVRVPGAGLQRVTVIGPAPRTDPLTRGAALWATTDGTRASVGQRLAAWLGERESTLSGYPIPASALVYREGAPWLYVEGPPGTFRRRRVGAVVHTADGPVVRIATSEPLRIVVRGAQTLLSEELRWNIPDEDELE